jgi:hypothetical protein
VKKRSIYSLFFSLLLTLAWAQNAVISGVVRDEADQILEGTSIGVLEDGKYSAITNEKGFYALSLPPNKEWTITFFNISFEKQSFKMTLKPGETKTISPKLKFKNALNTVEVDGSKSDVEVVRIDPKNFSQLPSVSGNIEDLIKTQIGVSSNNELSSGYSVRGGNFDENLVYVNDIEVYRPFLARSGQQEGLSFANPEMVSNINFSAGGFEARYGDKMSSVLDITYKKPLKFGGSASASLLGGNLHLEGVTKNRVLAWSIGSRYRTNTYLLRGLDTQGEYLPRFIDVQSFLTFDFNPKFKLEFLGNIANNRYLVRPATRETTFGTVNDALKLTVYFEGQELMQYTTVLGGLSATYLPKPKVKLKFITSAYRANEEELYTVLGQYFIDQLEADFGKPTFGQVAFNRGVGSFLNNGRNYLTAMVGSGEHKGAYYISSKSELLWGAKAQVEQINDKLGEWRLVDSAGYLSPYSANSIDLMDVYKTTISLNSQRVQGYVQYNNKWELRDTSSLTFTGGVRSHYWSVNQQVLISPRITLVYKPHWKRDWLFRFSSGLYYQPPFYRELRNIQGTLNKQVKAQQSIHVLLSSDYVFKMWKRPFKLITAGYFKQLNSLNTYEIDNVRVRYFANNNSTGYASGIDLRINGEFVKGVESWASIGMLQTREKSPDNIHFKFYNKDGEEIIKGRTFDQVKVDSVRIDPGYIRRPNDQLITFGLFFQDYLPKLPSCKFNLNMNFGTGLPFGPPTHLRYQQIFKMPPYRRVDAGFAYNILKEGREKKRKNVMNHVKDIWLFAEVLNILQVNNTVSYTWLQDVTGQRYAVPNYLTNRQINVRLYMTF